MNKEYIKAKLATLPNNPGSYQMKDKFILMPVSIEDMDGVENFAALIIRKDNPNILDIVAEFSNTVAMFRVKPNSLD